MAARLPVQEVIDKFLADNRNLAGSRDGFPALALNLNRVRELSTYIDSIWKTFIVVADALEIDPDAAMKESGKPSDVFIKAIEAKKKNIINLVNHAAITLEDCDGEKVKYASVQDVFEIMDEEL
jgi:predicted CopG family antitoxin